MATPGSPESDIGSFECFQNYTAPEVFVQGLAGQINQEDVEAIIRAQKQMLQRFEKTNEMLSNCNRLSYSRFALAQKELKKHTTLMNDMKKDLDNIFKRIRNLKVKISSQYPTAYAEAQANALNEIDEDIDEENETAAATASQIQDTESKDSSSVVTKSDCNETLNRVSTAVVKDNDLNRAVTEVSVAKEMNNSSSADSISTSNSGKASSSSSF